MWQCVRLPVRHAACVLRSTIGILERIVYGMARHGVECVYVQTVTTICDCNCILFECVIFIHIGSLSLSKWMLLSYRFCSPHEIFSLFLFTIFSFFNSPFRVVFIFYLLFLSSRHIYIIPLLIHSVFARSWNAIKYSWSHRLFPLTLPNSNEIQ